VDAIPLNTLYFTGSILTEEELELKVYSMKPFRAMIALSVVVILILSLPYPVFSTSIYGWREFIVLADDALIKVNVGVSAKGNVWDLSYPLEVIVDATLLREEKVKPTYIYLELVYMVNNEVLCQDDIYVGSISSLNGIVRVSLQAYPKGEIIEKVSENIDSLEVIPSIIIIRSGKVFKSQPAAPFTIPVVPPIGKTMVSSSSFLSLGSNSTIYFTISTEYPWNPVSETPILNVEILGEKISSKTDIIAIVQINGRMVTSQYIGTLTGNFRKNYQIHLPTDLLKTIAIEEYVKVTIEFMLLSSNSVRRKSISLLLRSINPENAVKIYVKTPASVFSGEEFSINIVAKNTLIGTKANLATLEIYVDNSLVKVKELSNVSIPPLSTYELSERLTLNTIGDHNMIVKLHYAIGMYYGVAEKGPLKISVLNPIKLNTLTNETRPGGQIVLKAYIGLPYAKAKLQIFNNETEEWATIKEVYLEFPEKEIKITAPFEQGIYLYRLLLENGIGSNSVSVIVSEKYSVKTEEKPGKEQEVVKVRVAPTALTVLPRSNVSLTATISKEKENVQVELVKFEETVDDWVLMAKVNITTISASVFKIDFVAPSKPGVYKYKVVAIENGQKIGESNVITMVVSSENIEEKTPAQPIIPLEMFTATISSVGALSFIMWRRYRT